MSVCIIQLQETEKCGETFILVSESSLVPSSKSLSMVFPSYPKGSKHSFR